MNNLLTGSWKLVNGYTINDSKKNEYSSDTMNAMKILSGKSICFVSFNNEQFYAAGSGHYLVDGNMYCETVEKASWTTDKNLLYKFEYKISGNRWENWKYEDGEIAEYELWERIAE